MLESSFIKVAGLSSATLSKRDSKTGVFLLNVRNSQEHIFRRASANGWLLLMVVKVMIVKMMMTVIMKV